MTVRRIKACYEYSSPDANDPITQGGLFKRLVSLQPQIAPQLIDGEVYAESDYINLTRIGPEGGDCISWNLRF